MKMLISKLNFLLFFAIYLTRFDFGSGIAVIIGQTASIDCYDPEIAQNYNKLFIELKFISSIPGSASAHILSYQPYNEQLNVIDKAYKGRIEFYAGMLYIKFVGSNDEGTFVCTTKGHKISETSRKTVITVYVPPRLEVKMGTDPLEAGGDVFVEVADCSAHQGKPPAQIEWVHDGIHIQYRQYKTNTTKGSLTTVTSTLELIPQKSYNLQVFRCEIRHASFLKTNVSTIKLNITYTPSLPRILVDQSTKSLTCISDGNPLPSYEWTLPSGSIPPKRFGASVTLLTPYDANRRNDTYTCVAINKVGRSDPVNVTTYEALQLAEVAQQGNVSLIVGISVGIVAVFVIFGCYCFFVRSRSEKKIGYSTKKRFIGSDKDRYSRTGSYHPSSDLYRPPSHSLYHSDNSYPSVYDDEDEFDVDLEGEYQRASKVGFADTSVNFKPSWKPVRSKKQRPAKKKSKAYVSEESSDEVRDDASYDMNNITPRYDYTPDGDDDDELSIDNESIVISDDRPLEPPPKFDTYSKPEVNLKKSEHSHSKQTDSFNTKPVLQYSEV